MSLPSTAVTLTSCESRSSPPGHELLAMAVSPRSAPVALPDATDLPVLTCVNVFYAHAGAAPGPYVTVFQASSCGSQVAVFEFLLRAGSMSAATTWAAVVALNDSAIGTPFAAAGYVRVQRAGRRNPCPWWSASEGLGRACSCRP